MKKYFFVIFYTRAGFRRGGFGDDFVQLYQIDRSKPDYGRDSIVFDDPEVNGILCWGFLKFKKHLDFFVAPKLPSGYYVSSEVERISPNDAVEVVKHLRRQRDEWKVFKKNLG